MVSISVLASRIDMIEVEEAKQLQAHGGGSLACSAAGLLQETFAPRQTIGDAWGKTLCIQCLIIMSPHSACQPIDPWSQFFSLAIFAMGVALVTPSGKLHAIENR